MTAGSYGYGSMRATDADRENVRTVLQDAHAEGRLTWEEFDSRSTTLLQAQTYDQLATLTADLPNRIAASPPQMYPYPPAQYGAQSTNGLAIAALICGVCQVFFWFLTGVPAIVLGHMARKQIRQTGEAGDGLALAGLILGYIGVALGVLFGIFIVIVVVAAVHGTGVNPGPPVPGGPPGP